jgi:hypothetical protein
MAFAIKYLKTVAYIASMNLDIVSFSTIDSDSV